VTNDANGLSAAIDCRGFKNLTLEVLAGLVGTSVDAALTYSATSGGVYTAPTPAQAITQITAGATIVQLDAEIPAGMPFCKVVLVQVGATTVAAAVLRRRDPMSINRP